jgi:hypothetical protein
MPTKRVAIVQSSYIPWKGYFDLIRAADEFILLDDVQFTKRDWRSRNRIKTKDGPSWLTIPVHTKGKYQQTIAETAVSDAEWSRRHWQTIRGAYARAPYFEAYAGPFAALYSAPVITSARSITRSSSPSVRRSASPHPSRGRQSITRVTAATSGSSTCA